MKNDPARKRLARIRCLLDSIKCMENGRSLPLPLCFVANEVEYVSCNDEKSRNGSSSLVSVTLAVRKKPLKSAEKLGEINITGNTQVFASGEEFFNNEGGWIKLNQKSLQKVCFNKSLKEGWVLTLPYDVKQGISNPLLQQADGNFKDSRKSTLDNTIKRWEEAVEMWYALSVTDPPSLDKYADRDAMRQLSTPAPKWCIEADEELARFLSEHINQQEAHLGNISRYVDHITASTEEDSVKLLTDGDPDTYWESDGSQSRHWLKLHMKPGIIVKRLLIGVDAHDDNYMPYHVVVMGGESGNMRQIGETYIDMNMTGDALILQDMTKFFPIIEIRIKECKDDGIDTRIHGIKVVSTSEKEPGLSRDLFTANSLVRFPKLDAVEPQFLYKRSQVLLRFSALLDSVIHYLLPSWNYTAGSFNNLETIRQLLPLSRRRNALIEKFLKESMSCNTPTRMPKLFINRRTAADHRADPSQDPDAKQSIFNQLYEGLRPDRCGVKLDFRWSARYDQWWECKFLSEGIIDQGGGFRDSLADMAEELCPSSNDTPMPLPFFVRSPNQVHDASNVNRDAYTPNPSCRQFAKYEWIGVVMGGCLRSGREHLVLSLPSFVWKQLVGEKVSWSRDFSTVDYAQVKIIESLEAVDKETFDVKFGGVLLFTAVLSDNSVVSLVPGGMDKFVEYEERMKYIKLVQAARMNESRAQIDALRRGLLKVVPQGALDLITWQELEKRVCGNAELTVESLKKCTHYEDISENDRRVKYLWKALENFTNEDRSRFLRFVSGRRRLPAPLYICPGRSSAQVDSLPEAATCSSTLFIPEYSSAKVAEEKLRYAAYNCVAIDTDMTPWEE